MKTLISLTLFFCLISSENSNAQSVSADEVLRNVSKKLDKIESLIYNYRRELSYSSEGYHNIMSGNVLFDFSSRDTLIGLKYQVNDDDFLQVFNGMESFIIKEKGKIMEVDTKPTLHSMSSMAFFYNSIATLKKSLPSIISDKAILKIVTDTTIKDKTYYSLRLTLNQRSINPLGGFSTLTVDRNTIYKILVDKSSLLPVQILQKNNVNDDFVKTDFTEIQLDNKKPLELSWYYSTYRNDYRITDKKVLKLIAAGTVAPDWELPVHKTNKIIKLDQLKGNMVLLAFWIKNCSYCIASVPLLNSLAARYKEKNVNVLAINMNDTKEEIDSFSKLHGTDFTILNKGENLATAYGVGGFPMAVLIDQSGKVSYSGTLDTAVIENIIDKQLKNY